MDDHESAADGFHVTKGQDGTSVFSVSANDLNSNASSGGQPATRTLDGLLKRPGTSGKPPDAEFAFSKANPTKPNYFGTRKGPLAMHMAGVKQDLDSGNSAGGHSIGEEAADRRSPREIQSIQLSSNIEERKQLCPGGSPKLRQHDTAKNHSGHSQSKDEVSNSQLENSEKNEQPIRTSPEATLPDRGVRSVGHHHRQESPRGKSPENKKQDGVLDEGRYENFQDRGSPLPPSQQKLASDVGMDQRPVVSKQKHQSRRRSLAPIEPKRVEQLQSKANKRSSRPNSRGKKRLAAEMERVVESIETQDDALKGNATHLQVDHHMTGDIVASNRKCDPGNGAFDEQLGNFVKAKRFKGKALDKFDFMRKLEMEERAKDRHRDEIFISKLKAEILKRIGTIERLEKELEAESEFLQDAKTENEYLESNLSSLRSKNEELESKLADHLKQREGMEGDLEQHKHKVLKKKQRLLMVEEELQDTKYQLAAAETRMKELDKQLEEKGGLAAEARNESSELKAQLKTATENFRSLDAKLNNGKIEIIDSFTKGRDFLNFKLDEQNREGEGIVQTLKGVQSAIHSQDQRIQKRLNSIEAMEVVLLANHENASETTTNLLHTVKAEMNVTNSSLEIVHGLKVINTQLAERVRHLKVSLEAVNKERDENLKREKSLAKDCTRFQSDLRTLTQRQDSETADRRQELSQRQQEYDKCKQMLEKTEAELRGLQERQEGERAGSEEQRQEQRQELETLKENVVDHELRFEILQKEHHACEERINMKSQEMQQAAQRRVHEQTAKLSNQVHQLQLERDQIQQDLLASQEEVSKWKSNHEELACRDKSFQDDRYKLQNQLSAQTAQIADLQHDLNEAEASRADLQSRNNSMQENFDKTEADFQARLQALQQAAKRADSHNDSETIRQSSSPRVQDTESNGNHSSASTTAFDEQAQYDSLEDENQSSLNRSNPRRRADRRTTSVTGMAKELFRQEKGSFRSTDHSASAPQGSGEQMSFTHTNERLPQSSPWERADATAGAARLSIDNLDGAGQVPNAFSQGQGFQPERTPQLQNDSPVRTQVFSANSGFRRSRHGMGTFSASSRDDLATPTGPRNTINPQQLWRNGSARNSQNIASMSPLDNAPAAKAYSKKRGGPEDTTSVAPPENLRKGSSALDANQIDSGPKRKKFVRRSNNKGIADHYSPPKTRSLSRVAGAPTGALGETLSTDPIADKHQQQHSSMASPYSIPGKNKGARQKARKTNTQKRVTEAFLGEPSLSNL